MYQVPRNRIARHQRILRQHNQSNLNRQHRPCSGCQRNANSRTEVVLHHRAILVQFQLHRAANPAPAVLHRPGKTSGNNCSTEKNMLTISFSLKANSYRQNVVNDAIEFGLMKKWQ